MTNFIRSVAYATAPLVAFVYALGYACGKFLHEVNSDLALFHRSLFYPASLSPFVSPLYEIAMELETTMSTKQLQALFNHKRKSSKFIIIASGISS